MARTLSNMLPLGTVAPDFSLLDTTSDEVKGLNTEGGAKGTIVAFICNHCPFVVHIMDGFVQLAKDYEDFGIATIAISSNDVDNYPQDGPALMKKFAMQNDFNFPYLYDESQDIAKAYEAACTPDFYLFDENKVLVYRGQMDGARPGSNLPNDGADLRKAIDSLIAGDEIDENQVASMGCNIKWKLDIRH